MRTARHEGHGIYTSTDDGEGASGWSVKDHGDYTRTEGELPPASTYGIPEGQFGEVDGKTWINGEFVVRDLDAREGKWVPGLVRVTWPTSETTSVILESRTLSRDELLDRAP